MTPAEQAIAANRAHKANRIAAEILRRAAEQHIATDSAALIRYFDNLGDAEMFLIWRAARCSRCPSAETLRFVRGLLQERLVYVVSDDDRALMLEHEAAR
jgi:hypothetical protein